MSDPLERIRQRIDGLDDRLSAARSELYALVADARRDVHMAIVPVGLELNEKRADDRRILDTMNAVALRLARIEDAIAADRDERPARQEAVDTRLAAIEHSQSWRMVVPWVALAIVTGLIVGALVW